MIGTFFITQFSTRASARDMQDTFLSLVTLMYYCAHIPLVLQTRVMTSQKPPIRFYVQAGFIVTRPFRPDPLLFPSGGGLYIDKNISFADLKQALLYFAKEMFGGN